MTAAPVLAFTRNNRFTSEPFEAIKASATTYLIKGVLPRRGLAFLVGASGSGKSFVALDWTLKIASGAKVMGRKAKHMGIIYVGAEDPEGLRTRIHAWKSKNPRGSFTPFRLIGRGVNLLDDNDVDELLAEILLIREEFAADQFELGAVVFDTWSRCIPGAEENASAQMSIAVAAADRIAMEARCLALAVAHHGKDGQRGIRGWSGQYGAADAVITVERDDETGTRSLTFTKVKNGQDGGKVGFALDRVPTGVLDEDGEEIWSCVVGYEEAPEAKPTRRKALSAAGEVALAAIRYITDHGPNQPPPPHVEGVRPGTRAVRRSDVSLQAQLTGLGYDGEKADAYRQRFGRAITELKAQKRIRVEGDAIWLI